MLLMRKLLWSFLENGYENIIGVDLSESAIEDLR